MFFRSFQTLFLQVFNKRDKKCSAGVTLVELAVSIGIFAVLTTVIVFNYADFNSNLLMTNLSYEIGLFVRQAQVSGTAVLGRGSGFEPGNFDDTYGVAFDLNYPNQIVMFIDDGDQAYTGDGTCDDSDSECLEKILISRGVKISGICVEKDKNPTCYESGDDAVSLNIMFKRPEPSAIIRLVGDDELYEKAVVELVSPQGRKRSVTISPSGQISIKAGE